MEIRPISDYSDKFPEIEDLLPDEAELAPQTEEQRYKQEEIFRRISEKIIDQTLLNERPSEASSDGLLYDFD